MIAIVRRLVSRLMRSLRSFTAFAGSGPLKRPLNTPYRILLVGMIMLGTVIAVTTWPLIMHLREDALSRADREQRSLSLLLANQAERAFEAVEFVQTAILERLQDGGVRTPEAFRQQMSGTAMQEELRQRGRMLPQLDAIVISDAAGNLINSASTTATSLPPANVADRDFYSELRAHPERTKSIGDPVQSGVTGKWTLSMARKVASPDGEFLGIVEVALALDHFEALYRSVAPSAESSVALFRQDGRLLARYPQVGADLGRVYPATDPFRGLKGSSADSVVVRQISPFDGLDRLVAARRLEHYPILVTVTNTISSILTGWRGQAAYLVGAAVILESLVVGIGMLMLRQLRGQRMLNEARTAAAQAEVCRVGAEADLTVARERERTERQLAIQNARFVAALSNMSQALCLFDSSDRLLIGNGRHAQMFGMPASRITPGATLETLLGRAGDESNLSASDLESMRSDIKKVKAAGKRHAGVRKLTDGRTLAVNFVPVENKDWLITFDDITERRLAEDKITHMARHDALTGLPNRVSFRDKLGEAVARSQRGESCAVLYLDLDHFKAVNDTLGHPAGDALLRDVTLRLLTHTRKADTVARLGGDEFAVVQSSVNQPQDAVTLATRLIEALAVPYEIGGQQVLIGTSVGIVLAPTDGEDPDQILKNADLALYRAKAEGRGRYRFFTPEMDARMQERRTLEIDLRSALVAGEFELFYQPLVNLKSGLVTGFEALMRWFHPRRGMIAPTDFIPLAEESAC
jgi:diguanylate cyclase (GGDEF)-like protein